MAMVSAIQFEFPDTKGIRIVEIDLAEASIQYPDQFTNTGVNNDNVKLAIVYFICLV